MHIYITLSKDAIVKWYPFLFTSRGSDFLTGQTMCLFLYSQRVYRLLAGKITIAGQKYPELERVFRCHSPKKKPPSFFPLPVWPSETFHLPSVPVQSAEGRGSPALLGCQISWRHSLCSALNYHAYTHCSCISPSLLRYQQVFPAGFAPRN